MLMGTLATSVSAMELSSHTQGPLTIDNVAAVDTIIDGTTPCYGCEDWARITINEDVNHIVPYYYSEYISQWVEFSFLITDDYGGNVFGIEDFIYHTSDVEVPLADFFQGVEAGTYSANYASFNIVGGSTFDIYYAGLYALEVIHLDGTTEVVYVQTANTDPDFTPSAETMAAPSPCNVVVDGETVAFDAYVIHESNYLMLRDLAYAVTGSGKEFNVTWDGDLNGVMMTSNTAYEVEGGELTPGDGMEKVYEETFCNLYIDGAAVEMEVYLIDGHNYFKLRDICKAFDIGVTWDQATATVGIDTAASYSE